MKLHAPQFEKALARTIKQRVKASPELRKEAKRSGKARAQTDTGLLGYHLFALLLLCFGVGALGSGKMSLGLQTAIISLWCFMLSLFHVSRLFQTLFGSPDLAPLSLLPASDRLIFDWQWQKSLRNSIWIPVYAFSAYLVVALQKDAGWPGVFAALVAAIVQWLISLSLATGLAGHRPYWPHQAVAVGLLLMFAVPFIARKLLPASVISLLDAKAWIVNLILPNGWVTQLFNQIITGLDAAMWLLLLAMGAVLHFGRSGREQLIALYVFTEPLDTTQELEEELRETDAEVGADEVDGKAATRPASARPQRLGVTDHLDHIKTREFLQAETFVTAGWIERMFQRWLTSREALLVEAFVGGMPTWTKSWRHGIIVAGIGLFIGITLPPTRNDAACLSFLFSGFFCLACLFPFGMAFRRFISGYQISSIEVPYMAGFPIGFREVSRLYFKEACVRTLAALPVMTIFTGLALHFAMANDVKRVFFYGLFLGFKLSLAGLVLQPALTANWLSRGMNHRQSHITFRTMTLIIMSALSVIIVVSFLVGIFLPLWWSLLLLGVCWAVSRTVLQVYIRLFDQQKTDYVMYRPTSSQDIL